jgi:XTP/dITP diphosphohydrolase
MTEKGQVSHRGRALQELQSEFDKVLIWIRQHMPVVVRSGCVSEDEGGNPATE